MERQFWPSGNLWVSFGARLWDHFGVDFGLPGAVGNISENWHRAQARARGGAPKTAFSGNLAPRASSGRLGLDFMPF